MWSKGTNGENKMISQPCGINCIYNHGSRVMMMARTCSTDSIAVLCSNFNRSLKEAADYLEASSTVINKLQEGIILYFSWALVEY